MAHANPRDYGFGSGVYPDKTPHEINPAFPENFVWIQFPADGKFYEDPEWYDSFGRDLLEQRGIWNSESPDEQIKSVNEILEKFPARGLWIMFESAVKGKKRIIDFLLDKGVKTQAVPGTEDDNFLVPLHAAVYNGHLDCAQVLIEKGNVPVNAPDENGGTPLMRSGWGAHPEITKWLLENGADPTLRQEEGKGVDALEFAAGSGCVEAVRLLLDHPVYGSKEPRKYQPGEKGVWVTPLALEAGAHTGSLETLQLLLERGGYPLEDKDGVWKGDLLSEEEKKAIEAAIQKTATRAEIETLEFLFTYVVPPAKEGKEQATYEISTKENIDNFVQGLFRICSGKKTPSDFNKLWNIIFPSSRPAQIEAIRAAEPDLENQLLFFATDREVIDMVKLLVEEYGADACKPIKPHLATALYCAAGMNYIDGTKFFLEKGGKVLNRQVGNGKFSNGATALWIAVYNKKVDTARLLLEYGGPVEEIGDLTALDGDDKVWLVLTAKRVARAPVVLKLEVGESEEATSGAGGEVSVRFEVNRKDREWIEKLELRKSDEELGSDGTGRGVNPKPAEETVRTEL